MKNKGITLVSLIITIMVILILSGVGITISLSVINNTKQAAFDSKMATIEEKVKLILLEEQIAKEQGEVVNSELTKDNLKILADEFNALNEVTKTVILNQRGETYNEEKTYTNEEVANLFTLEEDITNDSSYASIYDAEVGAVYKKEPLVIGGKVNVGTGKTGMISGKKKISALPSLTNDNTTFLTSVNSWTKENVQITIGTTIEGYTLQYKTEKTGETGEVNDWTAYIEEIIISRNQKIYARLINTKGEVSNQYLIGEVNKIDKLNPIEFNIPTPTITENSIEIAVTTTDASATADNSLSGIAGYRFSKDNGTTWTEYQESGTYKFENLNSGTQYTIKVEAKDNAENTRQTLEMNATTIGAPVFIMGSNILNYNNGARITYASIVPYTCNHYVVINNGYTGSNSPINSNLSHSVDSFWGIRSSYDTQGALENDNSTSLTYNHNNEIKLQSSATTIGTGYNGEVTIIINPRAYQGDIIDKLFNMKECYLASAGPNADGDVGAYQVYASSKNDISVATNPNDSSWQLVTTGNLTSDWNLTKVYDGDINFRFIKLILKPRVKYWMELAAIKVFD